jgi:hypothetical protein
MAHKFKARFSRYLNTAKSYMDEASKKLVGDPHEEHVS